MSATHPEPRRIAPAVQRLSQLARLTIAEADALDAAMAARRVTPPRGVLLREGRTVGSQMLFLSGWAARVRMLRDGRRQFLSIVLPGDLIGLSLQPRPVALSDVVALTEVEWCEAPAAAANSALAEAYATSRSHDAAMLLAQITRLGRMTAAERICDFLLEMHARLRTAGLTRGNTFDMPLTQEVLADTLGLTSVHVNRVVQGLRRDGDLQWKDGVVTLPDPAALAVKVGRIEIEVSKA